MIITVLIDNEKNEQAYRSEHGLAMLIEYNGTNILFDTGKSDAFIQNAKLLGKDLTKVDYVVLSHGHYDHTGGLDAFLAINKTATILLKKQALEDKWSISTGHNRRIGFPLRKQLTQLKTRFKFIDTIEEVVTGLFIFPNINKSADHTFTDSYLFVQKENSLLPDTFDDELFLATLHNKKLSIFTGCAHTGVENMVDTAIKYTKHQEVEFIIGGTHLNRGTEEQVQKTIEALKKYSIKKAAFNHCSGKHNIPIMNKALNAQVEYAYAGSSYNI